VILRVDLGLNRWALWLGFNNCNPGLHGVARALTLLNHEGKGLSRDRGRRWRIYRASGCANLWMVANTQWQHLEAEAVNRGHVLGSLPQPATSCICEDSFFFPMLFSRVFEGTYLGVLLVINARVFPWMWLLGLVVVDFLYSLWFFGPLVLIFLGLKRL
jgi:hypothetical protein